MAELRNAIALLEMRASGAEQLLLSERGKSEELLQRVGASTAQAARMQSAIDAEQQRLAERELRAIELFEHAQQAHDAILAALKSVPGAAELCELQRAAQQHRREQEAALEKQRVAQQLQKRLKRDADEHQRFMQAAQDENYRLQQELQAARAKK